MKTTRNFIRYYLLVTATCVTPWSAMAGIRVGNSSRSYAEAYNQVNMMQQPAYNQTVPVVTTPSTDIENNLPVRVADAELAEQVISGDVNSAVNTSQLESCAMIYPNGEFAWDRPTVGRGKGGANTCVAVVEMRGYQMGPNGSDVVLARANLAAGDSVKCNISDFPYASYMSAVENVVFPADNEPTREDVVKVMNEEQKQNAVLKIAAGAILGGLGGNITGSNDPGNDSLLGTDKGKMQNTVVGALGGAALMAGNAYSGKVAGDVILSTGVNAFAGGIIGNIVSTGDPVLRIEDCVLDGRKTRCLWGALVSVEPVESDNIYYNTDTQKTYVCGTDNKNCEAMELVGVKYDNKNIEDIEEGDFNAIINKTDNRCMLVKVGNDTAETMKCGNDIQTKGNIIQTDKGMFIKVTALGKVGNEQIAAVVPDVRDGAFGMKKKDWEDWKKSRGGIVVYGRSSNGQPYELEEGKASGALDKFFPMTVDAGDGSLIDFGNKARLKTTLIGAGTGGAMGAFVGYQGAQSDIENRWVSAVREYKDSLQKFYCVTGNRFLGYYNDTIMIPNMTE